MTAEIRVPTAAEIVGWPVTVDVPTAGRCWGIGRDTSYDLARTGEFPVPVLRLGRSLRITRSSILVAMGIPADTIAAPGKPLAEAQSAQVGTSASDHRSEVRAA